MVDQAYMLVPVQATGPQRKDPNGGKFPSNSCRWLLQLLTLLTSVHSALKQSSHEKLDTGGHRELESEKGPLKNVIGTTIFLTVP
jgi:hypothetical protein